MSSLVRSTGSDWRSISRYLTRSLIDFVLPPVCAGCGTLDQTFCSNCKSSITWVVRPICKLCGNQNLEPTRLCSSCQQSPPPLEQIRTATRHLNPIRKVLHMMKYEGYFALAQPLGEVMVEAWPNWQHQPDLVLPIPLHSRRKRERGYNQSKLLTDILEQELGLSTTTQALSRSRHTRPQIGLTADERRANVLGAFIAKPALVKGKRIMLVDDVFTTGSTLSAAAEALYMAGACSVSAYCLTTAAKTRR